MTRLTVSPIGDNPASKRDVCHTFLPLVGGELVVHSANRRRIQDLPMVAWSAFRIVCDSAILFHPPCCDVRLLAGTRWSSFGYRRIATRQAPEALLFLEGLKSVGKRSNLDKAS